MEIPGGVPNGHSAFNGSAWSFHPYHHHHHHHQQQYHGPAEQSNPQLTPIETRIKDIRHETRLQLNKATTFQQGLVGALRGDQGAAVRAKLQSHVLELRGLRDRIDALVAELEVPWRPRAGPAAVSPARIGTLKALGWEVGFMIGRLEKAERGAGYDEEEGLRRFQEWLTPGDRLAGRVYWSGGVRRIRSFSAPGADKNRADGVYSGPHTGCGW